MPKPWPVIRTKKGPAYRIFSVRVDTAVAPRTGKEYDFSVIESPDWVNIIPLTEDQQVVMVRQFRHGVKEVTLEIPGGMIDQGDSPQDAALRELREETGYEAKELRLLGVVQPNPAILNNRCYTYLARNLEKVNDGDGDETEEIEVALIPLKDIPPLIRQGSITNSLVVTAFFWYFMDEQDHPALIS